MWKKSDENPMYEDDAQMSNEEQPRFAMIGRSLTAKGEISGEEDLIVEGCVEGTITLENHCVTIGEKGSVEGDIRAKVIRVRGKLHGDLFGGVQVVIHATGNVRGNITAPQVCLENGAKLKGSIDMDPLPATSGIEQAVESAARAGEDVEKLRDIGESDEDLHSSPKELASQP